MSVFKNFQLFLFGFIVVTSTVKCTEFVPVYMWDSSKTNDHVPALHKISQDSFKEVILEHLKNDPYVVVFAEQTLSPEDFAQRDQSGRIAFPSLSSLKESNTVTYRPYVQNPIKALKHLDKDVVEISIESLRQKLHIPKANVLVVDLNDARDDEHRIDMLKRHDSDIISIYNEILKKHDNVLALYTAHHTSWVAPEEVFNNRQVRSLLADEPEADSTVNTLFLKGVMYLYSTAFKVNDENVSLTWTAEKEGDLTIADGTNDNKTLNVKLTFFSTVGGYWYLTNVSFTKESTSLVDLNTPSIYAPFKFSYHCGDQVFKQMNDKVETSIKFENLQIQPFFNNNSSDNASTKFGDAYDCVGFTSVPIWSGLFVTCILLLIMTLGLTMMMDIKTMDRFDDAKGKTITINVSE